MNPSLPKKLSRALLAEIASGNYRAGDRFLSNRKIMRHWNVSNSTTLKTLALLVDWGVLEARNRSGHYLPVNFREKALLQLNLPGIGTTQPLRSQSNWLARIHSSIDNSKVLERIAVVIVFVEAKCATAIKADQVTLEMAGAASRTIRALYKQAATRKIAVDFFADNGAPDGQTNIAAQIMRSGAQGVIILRRVFTSEVAAMAKILLAKHIPVVAVFDDCEHTQMVSVNFNNISIGYLATTALLKSGHRRIGVLLRYGEDHAYFYDRVQGSKIAAEAYPDATIQVIHTGIDSRSSVKAFATIIRKKLTAVFSTSEELFRVMIPKCEKAGIRIPEDLSVIICSSFPKEKNPLNRLDFVRLNFEDLGKEAFSALEDYFKGNVPHKSILVNPTLVTRGSVRPLSATP